MVVTRTAPYNEQYPRVRIAPLLRPAKGLAEYRGEFLLDGEPLDYRVVGDTLTMMHTAIAIEWQEKTYGASPVAVCPRCHNRAKYLLWNYPGWSCYRCSPPNESLYGGYKRRHAIKMKKHIATVTAQGHLHIQRFLHLKYLLMSPLERYEHRDEITLFLKLIGRKHL